MKAKIGDSIKWVSAAGTLVGRIADIRLDLNAANQTIPWIVVREIEDIETGKVFNGCQLPGTDNYFAMMKVEVI